MAGNDNWHQPEVTIGYSFAANDSRWELVGGVPFLFRMTFVHTSSYRLSVPLLYGHSVQPNRWSAFSSEVGSQKSVSHTRNTCEMVRKIYFFRFPIFHFHFSFMFSIQYMYLKFLSSPYFFMNGTVSRIKQITTKIIILSRMLFNNFLLLLFRYNSFKFRFGKQFASNVNSKRKWQNKSRAS